jgi:Arc/MetJ-type ribon-helix-helix transcriptional regulator
MSGTSRISTRITIRLPNEVVRTLQRRIDGRRGRWESIGEYLKERIIYDTQREHKRTRIK